MTIQENNNQAQTVDLSDLYFVSAIDTALLQEVDSDIQDGDLVSYTDDNGNKRLALYVTLWAYEHAGEASPYVGDNRFMAYVMPIEGGCTDYADVTTIVKLVDAFPTMSL